LDVTTIEALAFLGLVLMSAVFSGMESALFSLSEVRLRTQLDEKGLPKMLRAWLDAPNSVLASLLIGNNFVNITATALATDVTETLLSGTPYSGWGIPVAVGVTTLIVLVAGEVVPKTYAKHHPERWVGWFLPILRLSYLIFYFPTKLLVAFTKRAVGWLGGDLSGKDVTVTEEDIENMVRIGKAEGSLDRDATRFLTGVLELDEKIAREVMVARTAMAALAVDTTGTKAIRFVTDSGYSRYPVYEGSLDHIVGVLYVKDLLRAVAKYGAENVTLRELMRPPVFRPENVELRRLLAEMKRDRVHMMILLSEYGGVEGIVTLEDIVEEVFGPIYDEHDVEPAEIREGGDGRWVVEGSCTISALQAEGIVDLAAGEDYDTVAGLLNKAASKVPEPGYVYELDGWRFEVLEADETRVASVALSRVPTEDTGTGDDETDGSDQRHAANAK
jgi:CBS domain containing-hemolysin-like protein